MVENYKIIVSSNQYYASKEMQAKDFRNTCHIRNSFLNFNLNILISNLIGILNVHQFSDLLMNLNVNLFREIFSFLNKQLAHMLFDYRITLRDELVKIPTINIYLKAE